MTTLDGVCDSCRPPWHTDAPSWAHNPAETKDRPMPTAAPRICNRCGRLVPKGSTCPCRPAWEGATLRAARGRRWARYRRAKLKANPICEWPGCRMLATTVDHIPPLAEDGDQWAWDNLQSLCRQHDIAKTAADGQRGKTRARGEKG